MTTPGCSGSPSSTTKASPTTAPRRRLSVGRSRSSASVRAPGESTKHAQLFPVAPWGENRDDDGGDADDDRHHDIGRVDGVDECGLADLGQLIALRPKMFGD